MKRIIVFIILVISCISIYGFTSPKSMAYSNSYLSRSNGVDALYWNPSLIGQGTTFVIPLTDNGIILTNNLFDQDMNGISGEFLTQADKEDLLDEIDGYFVAEGSMRNTIFGMSSNNKAFGIGLNTVLDMKVTEELLEIILYGNENDSYNFNKSDINYKVMSYLDITYGMGGFKLQDLTDKLNNIPDVNYGFSISLLTGLGQIDVSKFNAEYRSSVNEGIYFDADLYQREQAFGLGLKANLGFDSQLTDEINVSMGFDNIAGFIKWIGDAKIRRTHYWMEDVYLSDLDEDLLSDEDELKDVDGRTTSLPLTYRMGSLYDFGKVDFSLDYEHVFDENEYKLGRNRLGMATEIRYLHNLPIQLGLQFNDGENDLSSSIGVAYRTNFFELGISMQSVGTAFPSNSSKSLAIGLYTQIKI